MATEEPDFGLCVMSGMRFSPDLSSPFCPMVGECGHSLSKCGIKGWYEVRQRDEYHKRKKSIPCIYNCSRKRIDKNGNPVETKIRAFKPAQLVPNYSFCQALVGIQRLHAKINGTSSDIANVSQITFYFKRCAICKDEFSARANNAKTPVVGVCGHTFCASCIDDIQHKGHSLKYVACPSCKLKGAFHSKRLTENVSFRLALIHAHRLGRQAGSAGCNQPRKSEERFSDYMTVDDMKENPKGAKLEDEGGRKRSRDSIQLSRPVSLTELQPTNGIHLPAGAQNNDKNSEILVYGSRKKPKNLNANDDFWDPEDPPPALAATIAKPHLSRISKLILQDLIVENPEKVANAMEKLSDLLDANNKHAAKHTEEAFCFRAHVTVLEQMSCWKTNEEVQMCGCFCLEKLAFQDKYEPIVIDAGGVEAVLVALHLFPLSVGVQYGGLRALKNMITGDSSQETSTFTKDISMQFVTHLHGILLLKHALQEYLDDEEIQAVGCEIIYFLAINEQFRTAMVDAAVEDILIKTKRHYTGKKRKGNQVNETATRCLKLLHCD